MKLKKVKVAGTECLKPLDNIALFLHCAPQGKSTITLLTFEHRTKEVLLAHGVKEFQIEESE